MMCNLPMILRVSAERRHLGDPLKSASTCDAELAADQKLLVCTDTAATRSWQPENAAHSHAGSRSGGRLDLVAKRELFQEGATRLLKLFNLIIGFVNDHPDVKRLPMPRVAFM